MLTDVHAVSLPLILGALTNISTKKPIMNSNARLCLMAAGLLNFLKMLFSFVPFQEGSMYILV